VVTPRGELVLRRCNSPDGGVDFEVVSNGVFLMDTRDGRSERLLVRAALDRCPTPATMLVGGLGVGFSLREALADDRVSHIDVVEVEAAVVGWHSTHLRSVSDGALDDPRVTVVVGDLASVVARAMTSYDVVCVDVDNGPDWTVTPGNDALYGEDGTRLLLSALRPGGVLSVWSARPVPDYERLLRRLASDVDVLTVDVAPQGATRATPDVVYLARQAS
jgi:spermidine synthase